jgi:hypothetical protein
MGPVALQYAATLYRAWCSIPFVYVFTFHSLFVSTLAPQFKDRFLVHYVVGGGGWW